MKKLSILAVLFILIQCQAFSQKNWQIGVSGSIFSSQESEITQGAVYSEDDYPRNSGGNSLGIVLNYQYNQLITFQTGLSYSNQGIISIGNIEYRPIVNNKSYNFIIPALLTNHYQNFDVPVFARISFGHLGRKQKSQLTLSTGGSFRFINKLSQSIRTIKSPNIDGIELGTFSVSKSKLEGFDASPDLFSPRISFGVINHLTPKVDVVIEPYYQLDIRLNDQPWTKNTSNNYTNYGLNLMILYNLKK